MSRLKALRDGCAPYLFFSLVITVVASCVPLGSRFAFGSDEGYEVMKALLVQQGRELYDPIWSDQPPLFTLFLAWAFDLFGPSIAVARSVVLGFTGLLVASFSRLLIASCGFGAAGIGVVSLVLWPNLLELGVSVMQIVPMLSMGLLTVCVFQHALTADRIGWFISAGVAFGLGLGIKLTTVLFLPALVAEWTVAVRKGSSSIRYRRWRHGAIMAGVAAIVVLIGFLLTRSVTLEMILATHFSASTYESSVPLSPAELIARVYQANPGLTIVTTVGLIVLPARRVSGARLPMVLLFTVFIAHVLHRPYWSYYDLHFAIPMSWITALTFHVLSKVMLRSVSSLRPALCRAVAAYLGLSGCVTLLITEGSYQWRTTIQPLGRSGSDQRWKTVEVMSEYHDKINEVFARDALLAFHAGLSVIPEVAVLSNKRHRAGMITNQKIEEVIRKAEPGLIYLRSSVQLTGPMREWIQKHYRESPKSPYLYIFKK